VVGECWIGGLWVKVATGGYGWFSEVLFFVLSMKLVAITGSCVGGGLGRRGRGGDCGGDLFFGSWAC